MGTWANTTLNEEIILGHASTLLRDRLLEEIVPEDIFTDTRALAAKECVQTMIFGMKHHNLTEFLVGYPAGQQEMLDAMASTSQLVGYIDTALAYAFMVNYLLEVRPHVDHANTDLADRYNEKLHMAVAALVSAAPYHLNQQSSPGVNQGGGAMASSIDA